MPRIWIDYCQFLVEQCRITATRRAFDRALRALPITQHRRIWPLYLKFVRLHNIPETAVRVYRRHLKLSPENTEEYIDYLKSVGRLDEAAIKLAFIVNKDDFVSREGKSNYLVSITNINKNSVMNPVIYGCILWFLVME